MIGSHLSVAGGMVNALLEAKRLGMDCVQVFTKNQRQWRAHELRKDACEEWLCQLRAMGWTSNGVRSNRVVAHSSYLINLAQPDAELWRKCIEAQRIEIERCEALDIPYSVVHPGAHLGLGEKQGLKRIASALNVIHRELRGVRAITCLEATVGSGTNLGYRFEQLAFIRDQLKEPDRVGFCMDTCHVTAAGYDMSTREKALAVLEEWESICGYDSLRVLHLNDSVGICGSRRDRHAHIGQGCCGKACFEVILNHPRFANVPKILETPKGLNDKGVQWDLINLRRLRRMMRKPAAAAGNPKRKMVETV